MHLPPHNKAQLKMILFRIHQSHIIALPKKLDEDPQPGQPQAS